MSAQPSFEISLDLLEQYVFKADFGEMGFIIVDEPAPLGTGEGPNPTRLLATAVANCLSASLIFALNKRKQSTKDLKATAEGKLARKKDGFWRVENIDVKLKIDIKDMDQVAVKDALSAFEDYCLVTQSIREGIPVSLSVEDMEGNALQE